MVRLVVTRLLGLVPLMLLITTIVFFMVRMVPGDPAKPPEDKAMEIALAGLGEKPASAAPEFDAPRFQRGKLA